MNSSPPKSFKLEFEGQFVGFCFQVGLGILDAIFDGLDRLVLDLQTFQFLAGGVPQGTLSSTCGGIHLVSFTPLEVVDEFF